MKCFYLWRYQIDIFWSWNIEHQSIGIPERDVWKKYLCLSRSKPVQAVDEIEEEEEEDEFLDTDEGASVWLESIGLDKKQFPSLDPNKVKMYPLYHLLIKKGCPKGWNNKTILSYFLIFRNVIVYRKHRFVSLNGRSWDWCRPQTDLIFSIWPLIIKSRKQTPLKT